jgi:hypothetical protein
MNIKIEMEKAVKEYYLANSLWDKENYTLSSEHANIASYFSLRAWFLEFAHPNANNEEGVHDAFPG